MKYKPNIMILQNIISPSRNPLFEELSKKYNLTVYFCKENDKERRWSTKLDGYSFKHKILPHKDFGSFVINKNLKRELNNYNFDVYILGENPENTFSIREIIKFAKKKNKYIILWNERINDEILSIIKFRKSKNIFRRIIYFSIKNLYKTLRKYEYNRSDYIISFSKQSTNMLISNKVNKNRILNTKQIMPESLLSKPSWKGKPKKFKNKNIIFHIGYLREDKGVNHLIEAFNKLKRKDTLLLIGGTGNQEEKLKELAKNNKNIIFLGYKDGVDKANYYSIADIFVFPTLHDCWGFVVNEAFYYGLPVISTDKAGSIELIKEGKTGFIVPDKDSNALTETMRKLLDNPKLLRKMKENVKQIPKSNIVDIQTTVKNFEKAINFVSIHKNGK